MNKNHSIIKTCPVFPSDNPALPDDNYHFCLLKAAGIFTPAKPVTGKSIQLLHAEILPQNRNTYILKQNQKPEL